jgi:ankyrin repeat protein
MADYDDEENPFLTAIEEGDLQLVIKFIKEEGIDVNTKVSLDCEYETPLHIACFYDHLEIVKFLVNEAGADIHFLNSEENTPLEISRTYDIIEFLLLNGANFNSSDIDNSKRTLLETMCEYGEIDVVRLLLKHDTNCNWLIAENSKGRRRPTSLMRACESGNLEMVQLLLKAGSDVNAITYLDNNVLIRAAMDDDRCRYKNTEIIELLLENGANYSIKNMHNETFFRFVYEKEYKQRYGKFIKSLKIVNIKPAKK